MKLNEIAPFFAQRFSGSSLTLRVLSAIVLAPVALLLIYVGGFFYDVAIIGLMALGLKEWMGIVDKSSPRKEVVWAYYAVLGLILLSGLVGLCAAGVVLGIFVTSGLWLAARRFEVKPSPWVVLGIFYLAISGLAMMGIRRIEPLGMEFAFYLVAVVWATDIGAYLAGLLIGGPKIYPAISPSKTWAGLGGGAVLAAVVGVVISLSFGSEQVVLPAMMGIILAVVSQAGDFFESFIKRRFDVKDSGTLIPGHGGLLDRIDGLLLAAIFFALLLRGAMQASGAA